MSDVVSSSQATRRVLISGSNRSGTTWVGHMLCASGELAYVHEPFNPGIWPRWFPSPVPARNLYVCADNEASYHGAVDDILRRRFPAMAQVGDIRSVRDAGRLARDAARWRASRLRRVPTLLKDPIAIFSSEWLATRFDMDVVVMVRNPLAYASSIKRLGWYFDFDNWLRQPLLVRDHLEPFLDDIRAVRSTTRDAIREATVAWNVLYAYVARLRDAHPEWSFVLHEDLAQDPDAGFAALYRRLGLHYDDRARRAVRRSSASSNAKDVGATDKGGIRRDSRAAIDTWRHRLTPDEAAQVREETATVAARFYDAAEWAG